MRETVNQILHSYYKESKDVNEDEQRQMIIKTAARLIKSEIRDLKSINDEYPTTGDLDVQLAHK